MYVAHGFLRWYAQSWNFNNFARFSFILKVLNYYNWKWKWIIAKRVQSVQELYRHNNCTQTVYQNVQESYVQRHRRT